MKCTLNVLTFFLLFISTETSFANVTLSEVFGDHMILQRNSNVNFWGWAKPNETVKITTSWSEKEYEYQTGSQGTWELIVNTNNVRGAQTVTIKGYNTIVYEDILLGEVWLASGQSNMEWSTNGGILCKDEAKASANYPEIRLFGVSHTASKYPQDRLEGKWEVCTPESMGRFSAIGYFFAKKLHEDLDVPIGIINSSWGGSPAEVWTDEHSVLLDRKLAYGASFQKESRWSPHQPGRVFNSMIHPLIPYTLAGVIWYQGESNVIYPNTYGRLLKTMVESWRNSWGINFPFLYVQIAPYKYGRDLEGVLIREALRTADIHNSAMIVINDIGNINDIHPKNKIEVGVRLANVALGKVYEKGTGIYGSPQLVKMTVNNNKVTLHFSQTGEGLKLKNGSTGDFLIAGKDGLFKAAKISVKGDVIEIWSDEVLNPSAVRHGWSNVAEASVFNSTGLPLSSFRTDDWEIKGFE